MLQTMARFGFKAAICRWKAAILPTTQPHYNHFFSNEVPQNLIVLHSLIGQNFRSAFNENQ